ncbi:hypothetical protein FIBSPDRAFT_959748 [Athelia psychrophila]|uniref:Uncharacterized protein n=1 Tax=Athelia psychrophila TaxID=1759441 RepID=A0A166D3Q3_9AGAM|nr:hypothetical protein FIBSPDRAFT_959748 [Fibularhizoctonia sp. CBS 109695]
MDGFQPGSISQSPAPTYNPSSYSTPSPAPGGNAQLVSAWSAGVTPQQTRLDTLYLWCDRLGNKLELKPGQYNSLCVIAEFGEQLETGDLKIHIIQQATSYQVLNTIESNRAEYEKFTAVLEDMSTRLGKTFTLNRDQLDQIIIHLKDLIFDHERTSYMLIHRDLERLIQNKATVLGFSNVYGNPLREKALLAACKDKASSARTQFRKHRPRHLESTTYHIATKMKKGGPGNLGSEPQLRIAVLEEGLAEAEDSDHSASEDVNESQSAAKKRKASTGVAKGKDFWSQIDRLLADLIKKNGSSLKSLEWRQYLSETVLLDQARYGVGPGTLIPSLPTILTPSEQPFNNGVLTEQPFERFALQTSSLIINDHNISSSSNDLLDLSGFR